MFATWLRNTGSIISPKNMRMLIIKSVNCHWIGQLLQLNKGGFTCLWLALFYFKTVRTTFPCYLRVASELNLGVCNFNQKMNYVTLQIVNFRNKLWIIKVSGNCMSDKNLYWLRRLSSHPPSITLGNYKKYANLDIKRFKLIKLIKSG